MTTEEQIKAMAETMQQLADRHNVKIDSLNIHISNGTLYIQEYTPGAVNEYELLEHHNLSN